MKDYALNLRPAPLLVALPLGLLLTACLKTGTGSDTATALAVGDSARGEITSSSPLNYNDGTRHQSYSISVKNGQAVALELGGALNGTLSVFDGQSLIAGNSRSSGMYEGEGDSQGQVNVAFKASRDGSYLVAVNSLDPSSFGPYALKASAITPYDGKPLGANSEANDWLISGNQDYTLKAAKAGIYTITMDSSALDAFVRLTGKGVEIENDDGGNGTNARLTAYLEPGDYTITASAIDGRSGAFKLGVSMTAPDGGLIIRDGTALTLGKSAHGMIDSRGRRIFTLQLGSPRQVQFDAIADSLDTVLRVTGPGINAEDDDGGEGTNARLTLGLGAGTYTVTVTSLGSRQGIFELETLDLGADAASGSGNSNHKAMEAAADSAAADAEAVIIR